MRSVWCWSSVSPRLPRSSTTSLKPPATPSPGIGAAPYTVTLAASTLRAHWDRSLAMMAVSRRLALLRLSKGSSTMNIEAKLGLLACSRNDNPEMETVCATPGVLRAISSTCATARLGPLQRRRVGQLDIDNQPALVLLGNEAGRRLLKDPVVKKSRQPYARSTTALSRSSLPTAQP